MADRGVSDADPVPFGLDRLAWGRAPAWFGLLVTLGLFLLFATSASHIDDPRVQRLEGAWSATFHDGRPPRVIELPGSFRAQGLPADARVFAVRDVVLSGEPQALWIDEARYALTVTWDGRPLVSEGEPGGARRSSSPVFVPLPSGSAGEVHRLGLDLRGDFGEGGMRGHILVGPTDVVHRAASTWRLRALATAVGLAMLGALPLLVASRGPFRPTYVTIGLAAVSLAVMVWTLTPQPATTGLPLEATLRIQRASYIATVLAEVGFYVTFVRGRVGRFERWALACGALAFTACFVAPSWAMFEVRLLANVVSLGGVAMCLALTVDALHRRVSGRWLLLAAFGSIVAGVGYELLLVTGIRSDGSDLLPICLVLMVAQGGALLTRDAATSERHERLLRLSPDALVAVDTSGRIHDANPAAQQLMPGDLDDNVLRAVLSEHRPRVRGHIERGMTHPDRAEFRDVHGRWVESSATPIGSEKTLLTLRDITARRELDKGMLQAARAETVGLLLGGIAHDFNNMLGTLLAHVGILRALEGDRPDVLDRLGRMEGSIERAAGLTRRLLTVARGTGSPLAACDLAEVCRGAVDLVEPTLPDDVRLDVAMEPELPPVHGDANDLEQVIVNLLVNARDAVGTRGRLLLAVRRFALPDGSRGVAVLVEDDGPGVPESLIGEIFQPFVTTKRHGTGLGLAVARQIVEDHLGRLWHERAPQGGARFLLALRHADVVDLAPAPLPERRRILLVDDEDVLLEDWQQALADAGYDPVATTHPQKALAMLRDDPPDLLLTDLAMEPIGGLDLAQAMASVRPTTPVLVVSAFVSHDVQAQLDAHGWTALTKPVRAARLVSTVGHLRRRAERIEAGQEDITTVTHLFPTLEALSAETLGFGSRGIR